MKILIKITSEEWHGMRGNDKIMITNEQNNIVFRFLNLFPAANWIQGHSRLKKYFNPNNFRDFQEPDLCLFYCGPLV